MVEHVRLPDGSKIGRVKQGLAWAVLAAVMLLVFSWFGSYKADQAAWVAEQNAPSPSQAAAAAAAAAKKAASKPTAKTAPAAKTVLVVSDVTLREGPDTSSAAIRTLDTGERLTLVSKQAAWYKVSDKFGKIGWVSASTKYTKLVSK